MNNNTEPFSSNQEMYDRINYLEQRVEELEEENERVDWAMPYFPKNVTVIVMRKTYKICFYKFETTVQLLFK